MVAEELQKAARSKRTAKESAAENCTGTVQKAKKERAGERTGTLPTASLRRPVKGARGLSRAGLRTFQQSSRPRRSV